MFVVNLEEIDSVTFFPTISTDANSVKTNSLSSGGPKTDISTEIVTSIFSIANTLSI